MKEPASISIEPGPRVLAGTRLEGQICHLYAQWVRVERQIYSRNVESVSRRLCGNYFRTLVFPTLPLLYKAQMLVLNGQSLSSLIYRRMPTLFAIESADSDADCRSVNCDIRLKGLRPGHIAHTQLNEWEQFEGI